MIIWYGYLPTLVGYGFAEVYDFTGHSMFDGRIVYVYNRYDKTEAKEYHNPDIQSTGIALGPIRLYKFPNARGLHSWKFLSQKKDLMINSLPETKELRGIESKDDNWDNLGDWYSSNFTPFGCNGIWQNVTFLQIQHRA